MLPVSEAPQGQPTKQAAAFMSNPAVLLILRSAFSAVFVCGCRHPAPAVLVPALRTVGNIVTGNDLQTQVIINCNALQCLLNLLLNNHKKSIKKETCWTISNITAGTKVCCSYSCKEQWTWCAWLSWLAGCCWQVSSIMV